MTPKKLFSSLVAVLVAAVWLVGIPTDAFAAPGQKSPLLADGSGCNGGPVGKSLVKTKKDGTIKVKVKFQSGPANDSGTVYWTCTNVSNGCHNDACGFISIGTATTDANGKGKFTTILSSNPFPGKFVHLDVIMAQGIFDSVFPNVPLGAGSGSTGASGGDPTK